MEEKIIQELIDTLKKQKRPEKIECPVYGQYSSKNLTLIYNDATHQYERNINVPENKTVRNIKAFANIIKEELRRRNNPLGEKATVHLNLGGGEFIPDDDFATPLIDYDRLNSQQWEFVRYRVNKTMNHKEFLLFLQGLKPSIFNFQEIFRAFATLRIVGKTELTSNPIFTEDGQNSGYTCQYKLEDGTTGEDKFPTGFTATVPFTKAGDKTYDIPIDLLFTRNEDNEIEIEVLCPEFEYIEERAIIDEADYIKSETMQYENLLVLSDF